MRKINIEASIVYSHTCFPTLYDIDGLIFLEDMLSNEE
jgi:hypothetical protein